VKGKSRLQTGKEDKDEKHTDRKSAMNNERDEGAEPLRG
jgi:hypothetical protein